MEVSAEEEQVCHVRGDLNKVTNSEKESVSFVKRGRYSIMVPL